VWNEVAVANFKVQYSSRMRKPSENSATTAEIKAGYLPNTNTQRYRHTNPFDGVTGTLSLSHTHTHTHIYTHVFPIKQTTIL